MGKRKKEKKVMVMAYFAEGHFLEERRMQIASCFPVLLLSALCSVLLRLLFGSISSDLRSLEGRWRCKEKKMKFFKVEVFKICFLVK